MAIKNRVRIERRGLSTIVGAVFMILIIAGALNVTLWSMREQDRVTESLIEKTNTNLSRLNEQINISDVKISNNKLNVTVTNTGGAASNLKTFYLVNETASPKQQYKYDINLSVDGRNSLKNIGQSSPSITLKADTDYSIRLVSQSGTTASTRITSLSRVALPMSMYLIPPTVVPGQNVTVLYAVTNNLTDTYLPQTVSLKLSYSLSCAAGPACRLTQMGAPASNNTVLTKGNTQLFKWVFKVTSPDKTYVTFNASLVNAKTGNYVVEKAYAKIIDSSQVSTSSTQIIYSSLIQRPEIFLILPSPFGQNSASGLFGVVVANPTTVNMTVSRVVISAITAKTTGGGSSEIIPNGCTFTAIFPSTSSEWTCPHSGVFQWRDVTTPEIISPLSSISFLAKLVPGNSDEEPAFTMSVAVFTNMGQFSKTGYSGGMAGSTNAMVNIFLSKNNNTSTAYQDANIIGHINSVTSSSKVKFNVTVVDFDTSSSNYLKSGTRLVVNVPTGFTNVTVTGYSGFSVPTYQTYADGSVQINADLSQHVGDVAAAVEAKVLSFTAYAPAVMEKKIYLLYTLVDGETNPNNFSAGALAEAAIQVIP